MRGPAVYVTVLLAALTFSVPAHADPAICNALGLPPCAPPAPFTLTSAQSCAVIACRTWCRATGGSAGPSRHTGQRRMTNPLSNCRRCWRPARRIRRTAESTAEIVACSAAPGLSAGAGPEMSRGIHATRPVPTAIRSVARQLLVFGHSAPRPPASHCMWC
jgi:hypothetical protein